MGLFIITGASDNHFRSLLQFLQSLPPSQLPRTDVWNFGLSVANLDSLQSAYPFVRLRHFPYGDYPAWFDIRVDAGQYAWKPVAIWRTAMEVAFEAIGVEEDGSDRRLEDQVILWCDAGNRLGGGETGLQALEAVIRTQGVYSPISAGTMRQWTHPGCLAWFGIGENEKGLLDASPRNGAIVGFDVSQGHVWNLLDEWAHLAKQKDCIAPVGSDRSNHRQDQAVLSVLYYRYTGGAGLEGRPLGGLLTHQDVEVA